MSASRSAMSARRVLDGLGSQLRERAKLEDFHFNDLRHSCATARRRRGAGLDVIAKILGHSSLAMTQR